DTLASNTATPPPGIRDAATRDAHANLSCNRFSDNVLNFRDLGVSVINAERQMGSSHASANGAGPMAGVVFRSAELGSAGERDVKTLLSKYGIRTIIDLRSELEARANDILAKHYPATMQPTADESSEKLLRLRAAQLRSTIVEVAAHDYEAATRPWERLGESSASWSRRNSLRYSRSIGNTRGDPVARAMAHLYDPPSDSDTQNVSVNHPYVPHYQPAAVAPPADLKPAEAASPYTSLALSAYEWGSETLQTLRSYWDYQWSNPEPADTAHTEPAAILQAERAALHRPSLRSLALDATGRASIDGGVGSSGTRRRPHVRNRFDGQRSRYRCNIIGDNYRRKCVWARAPLSTKLKVVLRFATFNKAEGIRTIGRDVLTPRGLAGSYEDYVDYCKQEFAAVLRIFADPCAYPILFHCHHGKDRTGIVAMLLLGILGVDDQIIAADYAQSAANLAPVRKRMELLDMGAVGLPPSFCDSPEPVMLSLLHHIRTSYGS
ncbi:hypothetical protein IWQ57_005200, partial [Coemansia nantahalensis]